MTQRNYLELPFDANKAATKSAGCTMRLLAWCKTSYKTERRDATRCDATMAWHGMAWRDTWRRTRFDSKEIDGEGAFMHISTSVAYAGLIIPRTKGSPAGDAQVSSETLMREKESCLYTAGDTRARAASRNRAGNRAARGVYNLLLFVPSARGERASITFDLGNTTRNSKRNTAARETIISAN